MADPTTTPAPTPAKKFSILVAGVSPAFLQRIASSPAYHPGPLNTPENISSSAAQMRSELQTFQNTDFVTLSIDPEDDGKSLARLRELVAERAWDGISFGGGVRTIPELGGYFTEMVNVVLRGCPGAVLVFPLVPGDVIPAIRKFIPQAD